MPQESTHIQFACFHCLYDLAQLRRESASTITCPECGRATDPYSKRAAIVRRIPLKRTIAKLFLLVLALPGLTLGFMLSTTIFFAPIVLPALIAPSFYTERILARTPGMQRRRVMIAITAAWVLGILSGIGGWVGASWLF